MVYSKKLLIDYVHIKVSISYSSFIYLSFFSTRNPKFNVDPRHTTNVSSREVYIDAYILIRNLTKVASVFSEGILAVNGTRFVNDEFPDCSGLSHASV